MTAERATALVWLWSSEREVLYLMTIFQTTKETPVFNRRRNPCFQSSAKPLFSIVGKTPVLGRRQNGRFSRQRTFFSHSVGFVVKTGRRIFLIVPERFSATFCCLLWEVEWRVLFSLYSTSTASFDSKLRRQALLASPYFALHCLVPLSARLQLKLKFLTILLLLQHFWRPCVLLFGVILL